MPESDFTVKVKCHTKIDRWTKELPQIDTHNTFTDFTGRYEVAQKQGHKQ